MQNTSTNSLLASIDAQRDALRCESAVIRFYPVVQEILFVSYMLPNNRMGVKVIVTLMNADAPHLCEEVEAYKILKPLNRETIESYIKRLRNHIEDLDDHAKLIEL